MLNKSFKIARFLGFSLFFLAVACSSESVEELRDENSCDTESVSYQDELKALLANNCAQSGCHVGPNGVRGLNLTQYEDVKQIADNGDLVGRIRGTTGNIMPPNGALAPCDIDKISAWVNQGAANN